MALRNVLCNRIVGHYQNHYDNHSGGILSLMCRCCSNSSRARTETPNLSLLSKKACISLSSKEAEELRPRLEQIVDWFGQLQDIDLENVTPAIRADMGDVSDFREDEPISFGNREIMMSSVPEKEGLFIKVPKILKENME